MIQNSIYKIYIYKIFKISLKNDWDTKLYI